MWVSPRYRGSGMAGELLDAVAGWARAEGARTLALHVADGNVAARRFYERHGFTDTGSGEPLRSDPAVTTREMRRPL